MNKYIKLVAIASAFAIGGYLIYKYYFKSNATSESSSTQSNSTTTTTQSSSTTSSSTNNTPVESSPSTPSSTNNTITQSSTNISTNNSTITSESSTPQYSNYSSPKISISPSSIVLNQGATITISGSGFVPNSKGYVSANNIQIASFTADNNGNFTTTASYYFNQNYVSGLGNAIYDATGNSVNISAYDYANDIGSNVVSLYFSYPASTTTSSNYSEPSTTTTTTTSSNYSEPSTTITTTTSSNEWYSQLYSQISSGKWYSPLPSTTTTTTTSSNEWYSPLPSNTTTTNSTTTSSSHNNVESNSKLNQNYMSPTTEENTTPVFIPYL